jgi:precorrin-6Y C5,15-methyltransferase (decarboxylating)
VRNAVLVIGLGGEGPAGLRPELRAAIQEADFLAGGERHLGYFPDFAGTRFLIKNNLPDLVGELQRRCEQRCVVLASGDPLFYGLGKYLSEQLGPAAVRIEPAVSSMQLAFARAGLSWQEAVLSSVHGRPLRPVLLPLLGQPLLGLFTDAQNSPAAVAAFFLERGLQEYEGFVGEDLGSATERLSGWRPLTELSHSHFGPLNYLILRRTTPRTQLQEEQRRRTLVPGVPDEEFLQPAEGPVVMTRREVRAVLVGRLASALSAGDVLWDLGTGLGTVAVEVAVLRPASEVLAVERVPARAELARQNCQRFGAYNVRIMVGEAPAALAAESQDPQAVFLGGSGGQLALLTEMLGRRLRPGGRLVAAFVTLEHLTFLWQQLAHWRWSAHATLLQVARSDLLGEHTGLRPMRGVFLLEAQKPAKGEN